MGGGDANTFIVVGSGVFGASTALTLVQAGHSVIVLDRSADGYAAPDAASNDLNKIVRADYSDAHYRDLAKTAISVWRRSELLQPYYHEVGVFFHTGPSPASSVEEAAALQESNQTYVHNAVSSAAVNADREQPYPGQPLKPLAHVVTTREQVDACFPAAIRSHLGRVADDVTQQNSMAYFNPRGGWAEAKRATAAVLDEAKRLGAQVVARAHVQRLLFSDDSGKVRKVTGVQCADGRRFSVAGQGQVVLCVGGWAEELLRNVWSDAAKPSPSVLPTWSSAQCVVTVQLTEAQRKKFAGAPVVLEFSSGFYLFEPDVNGLMKIAIHSSGYRTPLPSRDTTAPLSFPTFTSADSVDNKVDKQQQQEDIDAARYTTLKKGRIPVDQTERMLEHLRYIYPELADAPVVYKRICFYSESLDENWIIDHVPGVSNVVMASGDSGHAFKFLPILGTLVCARIGIPQAGSLTAHQQRVFSFAHHADVHRQSTQSQRESSNFKARL